MIITLVYKFLPASLWETAGVSVWRIIHPVKALTVMPMQILKVRGVRSWNEVKSNRLRLGAMLLLCLFASCHGNLFYAPTPDLISCLIDGTERGAFVSPWRKQRVNHGFKKRGKCRWNCRSRFIKSETNAPSCFHWKSDPHFLHLKMSI